MDVNQINNKMFLCCHISFTSVNGKLRTFNLGITEYNPS
jgi:hypothetical protein